MKWKERLQEARASAPQHHESQHDNGARSRHFRTTSDAHSQGFASSQELHEAAARVYRGDGKTYKRCDHADRHSSHGRKTDG